MRAFKLNATKPDRINNVYREVEKNKKQKHKQKKSQLKM